MSPTEITLYAANNSKIATYGLKVIHLDLGLRREIVWEFCIADVPYPIIGADLLSHYGLAVNLRERKIVDTLTNLRINGTLKQAEFCNVSTIDQSSKYATLMNEFPEITRLRQPLNAEKCNTVHRIETRGPPLAQRARRLCPEKLAIAKQQFREMVKQGICRLSSGAWASPILMKRKKDGTWRICGDFRRLNAVTEPDKYPVPYLQDFAANLHNKTIFSKLDLHKAYHQIPVAPEDIPKTAVITPFGLFEYTVMTFGLRNAGQTFQRYIFKALGDLPYVFAYIEDILIASESVEQHENHLRQVFSRLKEYGLRVNASKCKFGQAELEFLGFVISGDGCKPTAEKIEIITKWPKPETNNELRRWLGVVNFYRRSLPHAAQMQAPLHEHLRDVRKNDKRKVAWNAASEAAF